MHSYNLHKRVHKVISKIVNVRSDWIGDDEIYWRNKIDKKSRKKMIQLVRIK